MSSLFCVLAALPWELAALELAALLPLELFEALLLPDFCEPRADLQDINHAKRLYALLPETSQASSKKAVIQLVGLSQEKPSQKKQTKQHKTRATKFTKQKKNANAKRRC